MTALLAILFGVFLAYANGANDNFKGVATLFGSGTTDYRRALAWGTASTFLGSFVALILAQGLLATFSGRGLVPDDVVAMKSFAVAVLLASALTVMLATKFGFPISTTHSLTGALVGAGWLASSSGVNFEKLGSSFLVPLIVCPVAAIAFAAIVYPIFSMVRAKLGVQRETCVCIGTEVVATLPKGTAPHEALAVYQSQLAAQAIPTVSVGTEATCQDRYSGTLLGVNARAALDFVHFLSAGMVSFARGLNDTPKIAALLLVGGTFSPTFTIISVAVAMAAGGLLNARRVAETMSHRVTTMNAGQGFTANLVTSCIVVFASRLGLPVSTTHVSCGALFGIGAVTRQAHWKIIGSILIAWVTTLPVAAILGAVLFEVLKGVLT
ncbi:MAG: inorganic phosphate transporter [Deltaproteobacteria bacterium]|nr:inorganic phosphate transporter [Deltaproteobacteria bacterium]